MYKVRLLVEHLGFEVSGFDSGGGVRSGTLLSYGYG